MEIVKLNQIYVRLRDIFFRTGREPTSQQVGHELTKLSEAQRLILLECGEQMVEDLKMLLTTSLTNEQRIQLIGRLGGAYMVAQRISGEKLQLGLVMQELLSPETVTEER